MWAWALKYPVFALIAILSVVGAISQIIKNVSKCFWSVEAQIEDSTDWFWKRSDDDD